MPPRSIRGRCPPGAKATEPPPEATACSGWCARGAHENTTCPCHIRCSTGAATPFMQATKLERLGFRRATAAFTLAPAMPEHCIALSRNTAERALSWPADGRPSGSLDVEGARGCALHNAAVVMLR